VIHSQNTKIVSLITPQSVATNATATATVACVGFDYAEVTLHLATQTAANVDTTMTVTEGDGTSYATHADLSMTTVAPDTSSAQVYKWYLDLRKRKKNLKITYTPVGAARVAAATVTLSRAEQAPTTAALRGVTAQVVS
jgi:hypothetical protein